MDATKVCQGPLDGQVLRGLVRVIHHEAASPKLDWREAIIREPQLGWKLPSLFWFLSMAASCTPLSPIPCMVGASFHPSLGESHPKTELHAGSGRSLGQE